MKRTLKTLAAAMLLMPGIACAQSRFIILNDAGINGYKNHKTVAEVMGRMAAEQKVKFVIGAGDQLHMQGAMTVDDPIWITNFEMIYTNPSLLWIPWYEIAGNHEYNGNVDALIEYSNVSRRWTMPARYYSFTEDDPESGAKIRFIMLDTTPMQHNPKKDDHSDARLQDVRAQLKWIEETLDRPCDADWTILVGHHPVYANTSKTANQQKQLREHLLPILEKHPEIDYYICGHIHTFEHIVKERMKTEFIVNASAGTGRAVVEGEENPLFSYGDSGFMIATFDKATLAFDLIDKEGKTLYSTSKKK